MNVKIGDLIILKEEGYSRTGILNLGMVISEAYGESYPTSKPVIDFVWLSGIYQGKRDIALYSSVEYWRGEFLKMYGNLYANR